MDQRNILLYLHGYTAGPALLEFASSLAEPLQSSASTSIQDLTAKTGIPEGPLQLVLRTCDALGFVQLDLASGSCRAVQGDEVFRCLGSASTATSLRRVYAEAKPPFQIPSHELEICLKIWSERHLWTKSTSEVLSKLLDGIALVPILASMAWARRQAHSEDAQAELNSLDLGLVSGKREMMTVIEELGLGSLDAEGMMILSEHGQGALDLAESWLGAYMCSPSAFWTDLTKEIAFSNDQRLLPASRSDAKYRGLLEDLVKQVESVFAGSDFAQQPRFVVDTGCGDGSLLVRIYELVKDMPRGKALDEYPLTMVGIGADEAALVAPKMNMCARGIPSKVFTGDISNPAAIISGMKHRKIDPSKTLHVRAFQDQLRRYIQPDLQIEDNSATALFARAVMGDIVHFDEQGSRIPPEKLFAALVEHMKCWADAIDGSCGLCFSEEMLLDLPRAKASWDENEIFNRDLLRSMARRYTVPAPAFALAASMAGLFPADVKKVQAYPTQGSYCHTLNQVLVRKGYKIRFASPADLPALMALEEMSWKEEMRAPKEGLLKRMEVSPTTVLAVEVDGEVVAVLYMQRINTPEDVHKMKFQRVFDHHVPGGRTLQLIAINADTSHRGLGSELRCFALHLARMDPTLDSVCAVTLCLDFGSSGMTNMQDYVDDHISGKVNDRILTFHTSYGAKILSLVPDYRPEDVENQATGVLIQYKPKDWTIEGTSPETQAVETADAKKGASGKQKGKSKPPQEPAVPTLEFLTEIMTEMGYEIDKDNLFAGFFSSGLDSFDMGVIQNRLGRSLGRQLPSTLMLDFPSPQELTELLDKERGITKQTDEVADADEEEDEEQAADKTAETKASKKLQKQKSRQNADDSISEWVKAWRQTLYRAERKRRQQLPSVHRSRSPSRSRKPRAASGPWEKLTLQDLEKLQEKLSWMLKLPQNQRRLQRVRDKQHENDVAYINNLRPVLDSILGPVLLAQGLVKDTRLASMQDARDDMEAAAAKFGHEARARHEELQRLMQLENAYPDAVSNGGGSDAEDFGSHIRSYRSSSRMRRAGGNPQQDDHVDQSQGASSEVPGADGHANSVDEDAEALKEALAKMKGPLKQKLLDALALQQEAAAYGQL
mmetsp:Transcript_5877/g.10471  ORF Transcript_5877/g.10471 Transcript_5877/m.10471 type:complete len:1118 (-) Transcript_5877:112-3465(-)